MKHIIPTVERVCVGGLATTAHDGFVTNLLCTTDFEFEFLARKCTENFRFFDYLSFHRGT